MIQLPRFSGLETNRSAAERDLFVRTIAGAGYDPVGVAAVIELESARSWDPSKRGSLAFSMAPGYAVGLIQFAPTTAKTLGTSTAELERMTFAEQLEYVVRYYGLFGGPASFARPGDYYLAGWGASPGTGNDTILAEKGSVKYDKNAGLDRNGDNVITGADLRGHIDAAIDSAMTRGLWAFDVAKTPSITVKVENPNGQPLGLASVNDSDAPGALLAFEKYGAPILVAYPSGWRFLRYTSEVILRVRNFLPYRSLETVPPRFGLLDGLAVAALLATVGGIFWGTLTITPGRRAHAS